MSVIATVDVPAEKFMLGAALATDPGVTVRLERVIPLGGTFVPYFWAADDSVADIEGALQESTDVESFSIVDTVDGEALVRVEWSAGLDGLLDAMGDAGATILEAVGRGDTWTIRLRFDDHESVTAFYRQCTDHGVGLDIKSVHRPGLPQDVGLGVDLTDTQYETLVAALDAGYFDVPRRINLVDLAAELGVSDTAVSQRLRRGIQALLRESLQETAEE